MRLLRAVEILVCQKDNADFTLKLNIYLNKTIMSMFSIIVIQNQKSSMSGVVKIKLDKSIWSKSQILLDDKSKLKMIEKINRGMKS